MKRLIICCDGTWQGLTSPYPTNVVKMAQSIKPTTTDQTTQLVYYQSGLGTEHGEIDKITGGLFDLGIDTAIQEAYRFLCLNYEPGDAIYLFGFSRGAYTVRSLAGFLYCSGLLQRQHLRKIPQAYALYRAPKIKPSHPDAIAFRKQYGENVPIKLLGCWDTVGELGMPESMPLLSHWMNAKYRFHDTQLNRRIENALHAVAIDEQRKVFNVTPMKLSDHATTTLTQMWFPGTHSCVGGGDLKTSGLAAAALQWMLEAIDKLHLGLEFFDCPETSVEGGISPDYTVAFAAETDGVMGFGGTIDRCLQLPETTTPPQKPQAFFDHNIHVSVKRRWALVGVPLYRSKNLEPYQQWFDAFTG